MKTIQELEEIRKRTLDKVNQRKDRTTTRIVVGMATCGIAAGARPVLLAIMEEVEKLGLTDVVVAQTGCIGLCKMEPIVEVIKPGEEKVTYVKMDAEKARRIVREHIKDGNVVEEYTMHVIQGKILNDYKVEKE
ncbi:(2Fe-2S) ferredoxin domain-containing protein [Caloramator sp. mosi_1]|jgi:NADP-reducing hydrogenase subunit HndB|uniref:(2Fe-2S) ferredoxin domain-containing protein n=1 Tax=unclassified Caloramator TaxID=2629145 RepID=UPI001D4542A4|nr:MULTISPECIES: (2Fe-2S) ferredoxin domain-containing protein [unclassified Caloramator]MBZ4663900.1 (2Fe-2S) ferredoxin protein [Caloramator sp.]WDC84859.1 (2Fe-2S) ferredoxin domain-containing protein [Caloramator sp. mosi_1]